MPISLRSLSSHRSRRVTFVGGTVLTVITAITALTATAAIAASPQNRLGSTISLSERTELPQGVSRRVQAATALGHLQADTSLESMSLVLAPSADQSAALQLLLTEQQDPASPNYHKWLTPAQFGARFGVSDSDLQVVENWLTSQGLQVQSVPASRNQIRFSGTAATVESAFSTTLGRFRNSSQTFYENSTAPQIPAAFRGVVSGITGLSSFRMSPHTVKRIDAQAASRSRADYTSTSNPSTHYLLPYDVRQIYNANTLISSGYNGNGISIGVIGQSAIDPNQVTLFQTLTGQPTKAPTLMLVPGTGVSTVYQLDEGESEVDLEYAGGAAPGANLLFIYSGSNTNADVITALEYAITSNSAPILNLSYGGCEVQYLNANLTIEPFLAQANAQGQTILVSSGDAGAASCEDAGTTAAVSGAIVSYPASSPYVTGVGGTVLNDSGGNYWAASNNSQSGSALSYIPEAAWNDTTSTSGLSGSGGGASQLFSKPNWQVAPGVPADGARDVPDVAFAASLSHDPYLLCTSDSSFTGTSSSGATVTGACTATTFGAFVIGGTSLAAPSFAGMLALAVQANALPSVGNINRTLYSLASGTSAASAFNDVTIGNNVVPCVFGSQNCSGGSASSSGTLGYYASPGYDEVTGLGSVNIGRFSAALAPAVTVVANVPTVTIVASSSTASTTVYRITVAGADSASAPSGTVSVSVDGGPASMVTLSSGVATYTLTTSSLAAGTHTITAAYAGDASYATASSSLTVTLGASAGSLAFALSPTTLTLASTTTTAAFSVALTSTGYAGLVNYAVTGTRPPSGCLIGHSGVSINAGATVITTVTYDRSSTDCASAVTLAKFEPAVTSSLSAGHTSLPGHNKMPAPLMAAGIAGGLLGGFALRRRRAWAGGLLAVAFTAALLGLNGCGNGSTPINTGTGTGTGTGTTTTGTYNLTLTATSYPSGAVTASTGFTVVLQ